MNLRQSQSMEGCQSGSDFGIRVIAGVAIIFGSSLLCAAIGAGIAAVITDDFGSAACGFVSAAAFAVGAGLGTFLMKTPLFPERDCGND